MQALVENLLALSLDAAPWLLLGFIAAGLIKAWMPEGALNRWLGGQGLWPVTKAALIGTPLPLCSCGVLPAAIELRRSGASRGSTISFLIATPETGADSIALSYVLLGPLMAVIRPLAAVISAIVTGLLVGLAPGASTDRSAVASCGGGCCGGNCSAESHDRVRGPVARTLGGVRYALVEMVDDLLIWLLLGLLLAALISTLVPPMAMAEWGSGLPAMVMMVLIGVPMYICATASTPVAASLLLAGISPGTVLVFLIAGPATNIATIGLIHQEMGRWVVVLYLLGITLCAITLGVVLDDLVEALGIDIRGQIAGTAEWMPRWLAAGSLLILLLAALNVVLRRVWQK